MQRFTALLTRRILSMAAFPVFFCGAGFGQQQQPSLDSSFAAGMAETHVLSDVLAKAGISGSLEYNGRCSPPVLVPDLPPVRQLQKPYSTSPANTLRSMFSVDGRMVVSQESSGIIRVVEAGVQTDILQIRIRHLSFSGMIDSDEAMSKVLGAQEVQSFMLAHGIGQPHPRFGGLLPGARSMSGELNDVTVQDALDYILKVFPGFWLYQDCERLDGQRIVYFGLFPMPGRIWSWTEESTFVK